MPSIPSSAVSPAINPKTLTLFIRFSSEVPNARKASPSRGRQDAGVREGLA
jgi:hypothetical protein